jgi:hypothetical protein
MSRKNMYEPLFNFCKIMYIAPIRYNCYNVFKLFFRIYMFAEPLLRKIILQRIGFIACFCGF